MTATSTAHQPNVPYGLWPSPIGAEVVAAGAIPLSQVAVSGADTYWLEGRPSEGGRTTLLRRRGADVAELTPAPFNVRTRVHEYGGGACHVAGGSEFFSNFADNALYAIAPGGAPRALTANSAERYADFVLDAARRRLLAVCEAHTEGAPYPENTLRAVGLDGAVTTLVRGSDFYAAPRLSPDGATLAWLSWDHPRIPWQGTELWTAAVAADGTLGTPRLVAGGAEESICQPEWSPAGLLHFVSDRSGWWNLYRVDADGSQHNLCPRSAEFGAPHWSFGASLYGFRSNGDIVCSYIENGVSRLALLPAASGKLVAIANPYQEIRELRVQDDAVALLGGAPTIALELARIGIDGGAREVLARSIAELPEARYLSVPESITYSSGARVAHAFYYPPCKRRRGTAAGQPPAPDRDRPRRPDRHGQQHAQAGHPVLDQPRLRGAGRELWRQQRLRAGLPRRAQGPVGRRRRGGLRGRRALPGHPRRGRRRAPPDPRQQRRRAHHPVRADLP